MWCYEPIICNRKDNGEPQNVRIWMKVFRIIPEFTESQPQNPKFGRF